MATRRLTPLDTAFLQIASREMPMHVAALMIFELPEGEGNRFVSRQVERMRASTEFHSPWNLVLKKPSRFPVRPMMVENHDVDMEYHVRHLALPQPGGERELGQMIARLHSQPLDLRKPLWECHVIEGLENNRFAIYVKLHHALVDGVSGGRMLMRALAGDTRQTDQPPFWSVPNPSRPVRAKSSKKVRLPNLKAVLESGVEAARIWSVRGDDEHVSLRSAPRSIINERVYAQRRFATHSEAMDRLKAIARAADASLNDIVLAVTGMALREYLLESNALPDKGLTASIPVSLHEKGGQSVGNAVSMIFATLGTHIADDRKRLETIKTSTGNAKARVQKLSPDGQKLYPMLMLSPFIGSLVSGLAGRIRPAFNVTVSNVPGGNEERYLNGARLANMYPVSIPFHGSALNVTCYSHAGTLNFGLTACRDSLPHMQNIAVGLGHAVDRLDVLYCGKGSKGKADAQQKAA